MTDDADPSRLQEPAARTLASGIYGLVICAATLSTAAFSRRLTVVAFSVLVTVLVYWAAESYSHALARRLMKRSSLNRADYKDVLQQGWPLVSASYVPLAVLLVAGALGASVAVAVNLALAVATGLLVVVGYLASKASGITGRRLVASTTVTAVFGLVMIALKNLLH